MKQYSADLRERLLGAIDAGLPAAEGARLFGVCPSTIVRWRRRQRTTGTVAARSRPGRPPRIGSAHAAALRAQVAAHRRHLGSALCPLGSGAGGRRQRGHHVAGHPPSRDHGQKKFCTLVSGMRRSGPRGGLRPRLRPEPARLCRRERDESGLTPRYGRAPRGQRVVGVVPRNHGPNVTLLAAMGDAGITAAMTMTGAADGEVLALFVRQILVPSLRPGQIVIWDNLSVHKNQQLRRLIEAAAVTSASCRPIRRTSPPSSTPSASSRPPCARRTPAPAPRSRTPSPPAWQPSPRTMPPRGFAIVAMPLRATLMRTALSGLPKIVGQADGRALDGVEARRGLLEEGGGQSA